MPRKGKLERPEPASSKSADNKYNQWRSAVQDHLTTRWQRSAVDVQSIAGTVVGMFDAGATDAEVAEFLRARELQESEEPWLTDDRRMELVEDLHRSAAIDRSIRPSNEVL